MIFQIIKKESSSNCPVEKMCQILMISRSSYYDWARREPSERQKQTDKILEVMKDSHFRAQGMIGLDKLWADVRDAGFRCGRNRVYNLQKEHKLLLKTAKDLRQQLQPAKYVKFYA